MEDFQTDRQDFHTKKGIIFTARLRVRALDGLLQAAHKFTLMRMRSGGIGWSTVVGHTGWG